MPAAYDRCVKSLMKDGKTSEQAHAICSWRTGWVKAKGGGWRNKKTNETYKAVKNAD